MNFSLEGKIKQTVMYTYSTIMNFSLEGKLCYTETKRLCRITLLTKKSVKENTTLANILDARRDTSELLFFFSWAVWFKPLVNDLFQFVYSETKLFFTGPPRVSAFFSFTTTK